MDRQGILQADLGLSLEARIFSRHFFFDFSDLAGLGIALDLLFLAVGATDVEFIDGLAIFDFGFQRLHGTGLPGQGGLYAAFQAAGMLVTGHGWRNG